MPRRRNRRPQITIPTQEELDGLPVRDRLELIEQARIRTHQRVNSLVLLLGLFFTGAGLVATGLTLRNGQDQLDSAREGQITERYTQATQLLGAPGREVRTGAIYALERIARDSPRDKATILNVLAAFVRENDPAPTVPDNKLPKEPSTDVTAALNAIGRLPGAHLHRVDLRDVKGISPDAIRKTVDTDDTTKF